MQKQQEETTIEELGFNETESILRKDHFFVEWAKKRIAQNKNVIIVIVGKTGSGKSYSGLTLAKAFDAKFDKKQIAFKPKNFMEVINSTLPPGSVIMWEEAGVGYASRKWQSETNLVLGYLFQTF